MSARGSMSRGSCALDAQPQEGEGYGEAGPRTAGSVEESADYRAADPDADRARVAVTR